MSKTFRKKAVSLLLAAAVLISSVAVHVSAATNGIFPLVKVRVNGSWYGANLSKYCGSDNTWVEIEVDGSKLKSEATNYFSFSSNVRSADNRTDESLDLFASASGAFAGSYLCTQRWCDDGFAEYTDRTVNMEIIGYNRNSGIWESIYSPQYTAADFSTVLGQYADGNWYNAAQNIDLADVSVYNRVKVCLNLHVGRNLTLLQDYTPLQQADFITPPYVVGDVNTDGQINIKDLVRLKKMEAELISYNEYCDINGDGCTDALDMVSIRRMLIGKELSEEETPVGKRSDAVDLNGIWTAYADNAPVTNVYRNESGNANRRLTLCNGITAATVLNIPAPDSKAFYQISAYLFLENSTVCGATVHIGVRVNGGKWIYTDVSYYQNDSDHWVDLTFDERDLICGKNTVELCSDASAGVYVRKENDTACIRIKEMVLSGQEYAATVPGAAEMTMSSNGQPVRPDAFDGIVWYERDVALCDAENSSIWLCFDAVDYKAEVWINQHFLGSHEGGYTAFEFCMSDCTAFWNPSGNNRITVRCTDQTFGESSENAINIKETLAGFTQDTRMLNYCGIWQNVYLESRGRVFSEDIFVNTLQADGTAAISMSVINTAAEQRTVTVSAQLKSGPCVSAVVCAAPRSATAVTLPVMRVENPVLWTADNPYCYSVTVNVQDGCSSDTVVQQFGIRTVSASGTNILINEKPMFFTGVLHWGSYYDNYTSAVSVRQARYEIEELKADGFNAIKFCLYTPPDYVLALCDELGMYVYIEYPNWNVTESEAFFERAYLQTAEMLRKDRVHPSVILSDFNCEDLEFSQIMDSYMSWCVTTAKEVAPNRLYTDNSSNGEHKYGDFSTCHPYYQTCAFSDMLDGWETERGETPLILGEFGDICVLRDLQAQRADESDTGNWYHDYFGDTDQAAMMREAGYSEEQIALVIRESVQNAQETRKFFIEISKLHSNVAGMFFTHISNSPQGWADGWFDDTNRKYFDSNVIRRAAAEDAILIENQDRGFRAGKAAVIYPDISLYSGADIKNASLTYSLSDGSKVVDYGTAERDLHFVSGDLYQLDPIRISLPSDSRAVRYTLRISLSDGSRSISNSWDIWAYPTLDTTGINFEIYDPYRANMLDTVFPHAAVFSGASSTAAAVVTSTMSDDINRYLYNGGKVIFIGQNEGPVTFYPNTDFSRFSFAFLSESNNELVKNIQSLGYGGIQFLRLGAAWSMQAPYYNADNLIGRMNIASGEISSYLAQYRVGNGLLLQTTLHLNHYGFTIGGGLLDHDTLSAPEGENLLGDYLIYCMLKYLVQK